MTKQNLTWGLRVIGFCIVLIWATLAISWVASLGLLGFTILLFGLIII